MIAWMAAAGAFALPALFVLARLDSPSRRPWVRPALAFGVSLLVVWAVNFATVLGGAGWSSGAWFVAMNLGFLGNIGVGLAVLFLAWELTRPTSQSMGPGRWLVGSWVTASLLLWLVGLYRSLVLPAGAFHYGEVFTMGTLVGALSACYALGLFAARWRHVDAAVRRWFLGTQGVLLPLLALAVAGDVADLDRHWWGVDLPMSPFFLVASALLVYLVAGALWKRLIPREEPVDYDDWCRALGISRREREVLDLLLAGVDRVQAAERLFISPVTVKNHLAALYRKAGVTDLASLTAQARLKNR